jgi:hypothetical protein
MVNSHSESEKQKTVINKTYIKKEEGRDKHGKKQIRKDAGKHAV